MFYAKLSINAAIQDKTIMYDVKTTAVRILACCCNTRGQCWRCTQYAVMAMLFNAVNDCKQCIKWQQVCAVQPSHRECILQAQNMQTVAIS